MNRTAICAIVLLPTLVALLLPCRLRAGDDTSGDSVELIEKTAKDIEQRHDIRNRVRNLTDKFGDDADYPDGRIYPNGSPSCDYWVIDESAPRTMVSLSKYFSPEDDVLKFEHDLPGLGVRDARNARGHFVRSYFVEVTVNLHRGLGIATDDAFCIRNDDGQIEGLPLRLGVLTDTPAVRDELEGKMRKTLARERMTHRRPELAKAADVIASKVASDAQGCALLKTSPILATCGQFNSFEQSLVAFAVEECTVKAVFKDGRDAGHKALAKAVHFVDCDNRFIRTTGSATTTYTVYYINHEDKWVMAFDERYQRDFQKMDVLGLQRFHFYEGDIIPCDVD